MTGFQGSGLLARLSLAALTAVLVTGCGDQLNTSYGRHRASDETVSINGTDVLARMFIEAGNRVVFRRSLITSEFNKVNTIVWFPNDFAPPTEEVNEWFDEWLSGGRDRRLIYVGRDYDAAPRYWRTQGPKAPQDDQRRFAAREQWSADAVERVRKRLPDDKEHGAWFNVKTEAPGPVKELEGPWSSGIDPAATEIELGNWLELNMDARKLLKTGEKVLVAEADEWDGGKLITVANGSFLLNMPLVNHENRTLAGKLIDATQTGRVVFLESGAGGPPIDPSAEAISFWQLIGGWPLNVIVLQLAVVGIIFCFARWPIFGRPRTPAIESTTDFGKHVTALAQLLYRGRARAYAQSKLHEETPGSPAKLHSARPPAAPMKTTLS